MSNSPKQFDFVIQIIGSPHSGKSTISHMIQQILDNNRVNVVNDDTAERAEDFREVQGKSVLISILNAEYDRQIVGFKE
jgi:uridine kinase